MMSIRIFISSVQVMLFADRLEVLNPGGLPASLTLAKLREPHGSVPGSPLLAEPMYLTKYIERMGTGTRDMIRLCLEVGLAEPEFSVSDGFVTTIRRPPKAAAGEVTREVTEEVGRLLKVFDGEHGRQELQERLDLKGEEDFRTLYLVPALDLGLIEMTRPNAPRSRLQKYRLTPKGRAVVAAVQPGNLP